MLAGSSIGISSTRVAADGDTCARPAALPHPLLPVPTPLLLQVRVEAGCRVQQVADALKPYGLSLQNYASIREQQIGGFTQVSAHGTGAGIPPVDEQVVSLKLVTPAGALFVQDHTRDAC